MNAYIQEVLEKVEKRDKNEPEFLQTVEEVLKSLETVIESASRIPEGRFA
ncbi:MAG: hypothetical protein V8Q85_00440 [Christensenellales bacterium]